MGSPSKGCLEAPQPQERTPAPPPTASVLSELPTKGESAESAWFALMQLQAMTGARTGGTGRSALSGAQQSVFCRGGICSLSP